MSIFPINRNYRRHTDPFDHFFGDQLELFDSWNDFDMFPLSTPTFRWINEPLRHSRLPLTDQSSKTRPAQSEKCRFQLNVAGFNPDSIKTRIDGKKLLVEAKQEDRDGDDYHVREIRKSFNLPEHADVNNLASFVTPNNMLVIEVPVKNPEIEQRMLQSRQNQNDTNLARWGAWRDPLFDYGGFGASIFAPQIIDTPNGKQLKMALKMKDFTPEQIKVSVKNNDLVIQGEHQHKDRNRSEKTYFYKSCTLPPGTQIDHLQSHLTNDGELQIEAPFIEQQRGQQSSLEQQRGQQSSLEQQRGQQSSMEQQRK